MIARIKWLTTRLQTMRPAEIISRLVDVGRHIALCSSLPQIERRAQRQTASIDCPLRLLNLESHLEKVAQGAQHGVVAEALQWLNHRTSIFGLCDVFLGDQINWHRDYSSGVIGPLRYSGLINYRDVTMAGDVKYIWELNRLQHFVLLALASVWTGNAAYRKEIEEQTVSWCAQNPFMRGLNWKSPLEAGIRLISWAHVSFLSRAPNRLEEVFYRRLKETVYQHQYFIRRFYSKHSSANNHLIGEMAGLYVGSVFWPWYRESNTWQSFAKRKLIEEIIRQVEVDGVGVERATEYQLFILEFFLLTGALGHAIGDPFPPEYWERLGRMLTFLSAITDREGNLPMFGDGDSGQVVRLPELTQERVLALIQLGQSRRRFTQEAMGADVRSLLLLWGQTPGEIPLAPVPATEQPLRMFPQGGYHVLSADRGSDDELVIVFDTGPLGLPPLFAHGHADALSFWLSYGGREFLIDPGTFCYYANDVWRTYFRGTAAHNTVRIDGMDQSVAGGRFLWRYAAQCQVECAEDNEEFVAIEGCHYGYRRLTDPVIHWRGMHLQKKLRTLVITDRIKCQSHHAVEIFFHFSETCQVRQVGAVSFEVLNGDKRLGIRLDVQLKPELYHGSESPICGWISRSFGVKEPTFTLVGRASVTGSAQFLTEVVAL